MPSFDVVSRFDMQELNNAIANSLKEISQRYDFKGSNSIIYIKETLLTIETEDELKVKQVYDLLVSNLVRRKIDPMVLSFKSSEKASGNRIRQIHFLIDGIDQQTSKRVIAELKSSKLKVQTKIQGNELRIAGTKKDDLQKAMSIMKNLKLHVPLQFVNFRD